MNRISLSEDLIKNLIKIKGATQVREAIDLKLTKIPITIETGKMALGVDQIILPFTVLRHTGKFVLESFHAAGTNLDFKFKIAEFDLLKIGVQYFGLALLPILNRLGFSLVRRKGDKISIDLTEIFARKLPAGFKIQLTTVKIDHGIEIIFI